VEAPEINSQSTDELVLQDKPDNDDKEQSSSRLVMKRRFLTALPSPGEESAVQYLERQRIAKLNRFLQRELKKQQASSSSSSEKAPATTDHSLSISNNNNNNVNDNNDDMAPVIVSNDNNESDNDHDRQEKKKHKRSNHSRRVYDPEVFRTLMSQASLKSTLIKATTFVPKYNRAQSKRKR
jgi:hypothetical protein